jgi:pimeloyl-ACP methyl ester carboxylesterase
MLATVSQLTAPNLRLEAANGVTYAYRRFGNNSTSALPLVCLIHFRGNLDNWDPILVDTISTQREVILVDNAGVGGSTGTVPSTVAEMARDAIAFLDALGLRAIDLLGFSIGGMVAQEIVLIRPYVVRRLILAGTAPQGGEDLHAFADGPVREAALRDATCPEDILTLFFEQTASSQAKGRDFLRRIAARAKDRDQPTDLATRNAQLNALSTWGIPDPTRLNRLAGITQSTLVANGDNDVMLPTRNSYLLAKYLPNARLSVYPDAGHGFLFQYPADFAAEVNAFLGASANGSKGGGSSGP